MGLNNCWNNVVLQSLLHLESFRASFVALPPGHVHRDPDDQAACVRCALTQIFAHYEFGEEDVLPPDALRIALSLVADNQRVHRFVAHEMSDAEEALEEVLRFLHCDHVGGLPSIGTAQAQECSSATSAESRLSKSLDVACIPECIAHRVFGMQLMDQKMCSNSECGANSDPEMSTCFLYRIYMDELRQRREASSPDASFESMLKASYTNQSYSCPRRQRSYNNNNNNNACLGPAHSERWLLNQSTVLTLTCAWSTPEPEREEIVACFALLPEQLHPERFLQVAMAPAVYHLRGMVLFYGRHYVCVFYAPRARAFVMLDDRRVTRLGAWSDVIARCCKGKLFPTIIFYESAIATAESPPNSGKQFVSLPQAPQVNHVFTPNAPKTAPVVDPSPPLRRFVLCVQCGLRADSKWMSKGLCLLCAPPPKYKHNQ